MEITLKEFAYKQICKEDYLLDTTTNKIYTNLSIKSKKVSYESLEFDGIDFRKTTNDRIDYQVFSDKVYITSNLKDYILIKNIKLPGEPNATIS